MSENGNTFETGPVFDLTVFQLVKLTIHTAWENRRLFFGVGVGYFLIIFGLIWVFYKTQEFYWEILFLIFVSFGSAPFLVFCHRLILVGPPKEGFFGLSFGRRELLFGLFFFLLFGASEGVDLLINSAVVPWLPESQYQYASWKGLVLFMGSIIWGLLFARLFLVFPSTAIDSVSDLKSGLTFSSNRTKTFYGRVFFANWVLTVIAVFPLFLYYLGVFGPLFLFDADWPLFFFSSEVWFVLVGISLVALSVLEATMFSTVFLKCLAEDDPTRAPSGAP